MMFPTHIAGGIVLGGAVYMIAPVGGPVTFMIGAVIGSLVPDLDHEGAFLNRRTKGSSILTLFEHRTITHSILFAFGVLGLLLVGGVWESLTVGLFVGILSHLLLDMLNTTWVPLLWPYARKFSVLRISTGSGGEYIVLALLAAVIYLYFVAK